MSTQDNDSYTRYNNDFRDNEEPKKKHKRDKIILTIIILVVALLAVKLYFLWFWPY
ncbi:MAG: hypothetical protein M3298_06460 [Thermoproteota archaeon]|nr:hypothetical protein [Thermoproteota archaeon]MDQ5843391.1 hypothetical protein [Thermoproteota archaeon]